MFYHPAKANVIADALSRKYREDEANPEEIMSQLSQQFTVVEIDELMTGGPPIMAALVVESMSEDNMILSYRISWIGPNVGKQMDSILQKVGH